MRQRVGILLMLVAMLSANSGCCLFRHLNCGLWNFKQAHAERTYCCADCGEKYDNEWTSDPPACCDPCDNLGNYQSGHKSPWAGPPRACPNCTAGY